MTQLNTAAIETKTKVAGFNQFLQKHKAQLELALPKHLNSDRMVRLALTAFSQSKALQSCEPKSIFSSIIIASQLGLEPGVNGQGYLIPYRGNCTFVPGWKGLVDLAQRGGRASVWTGAVYEGDDFDYMLGDSPYCKHRPCGEFDEKKLTHVYAIGRVKDSEMPVIEVWPVKKVRAHFEKTVVSGLKDKHYANKHFEAYARKVALLQVLKYMPQSIELSTALDVSNASEQGKEVTLDGSYIDISSNPIEDEPQDVQQQIDTPVEPEPTPVEQAQVQQVANPSNYDYIKKQILRCKTVEQLDFLEDEILETANTDERKALNKLARAKRTELTPAPAGPTPVAQETKIPTPIVDSTKVRTKYIKEMNALKSVDGIQKKLAQAIADDGLSTTHKQYLEAHAKQRIAQINQPDSAKSEPARNEHIRVIQGVKTLEELKKVGAVIAKDKPNMTRDDQNAVATEYAQQYERLSQGEILDDLDDDAVIKKIVTAIEHAKNIDDLNAIMAEPYTKDFSGIPEIDQAYENRMIELGE